MTPIGIASPLFLKDAGRRLKVKGGGLVGIRQPPGARRGQTL